MTAVKQVKYIGTADVRVIDKLTWDDSNNKSVKKTDVPDELLKEMESGSLKGEFEVE